MKKILSLLFFVAIAAFVNAQTNPVDLYGGITEDGNLVFKFKNNSEKTIANCNFKFTLPEGVSVKQNSKKTKYLYEAGDATEDMTFDVTFNATSGKYSIIVYKGEFWEEDNAHTIISLPLDGELTGVATVSDIAFGDPDANNICRPEGFTIDISTAIKGISAEQTKSGAIYNLAGQRVSKATKGIYVVDGKKVAVGK